MNRTPSFHPSPPVGEKVPGGRLRGIRTGSWSQCTPVPPGGLSMNRATPPPHPSPPLGERVSEGRVRGIRNGSWSQCTAIKPWGLSMNRKVLPASCRQRNRRENAILFYCERATCFDRKHAICPSRQHREILRPTTAHRRVQ